MTQSVTWGDSPAHLEIRKTDPAARVPVRAHATDAGLDLCALEGTVLGPRQGAKLRTGLALAIPVGFVGMIADRSSMASKGLKTAGGIIDSGYRGEVQVVLWNLTDQEMLVQAGDRIAQLLVIPVALPRVEVVADFADGGATSRGAGGFGSSGR
jgi:dUTP pyrophosphatase